MDFEWSETKRLWVLRERGIDFLRVADALFDGRPILTVPSSRYGEDRFLSLVPVEGKFFAVIWMWREGAIRIVTARRARDGEEKRYRAAYG
jgi:hypothetical protein